LDKREGKLHGQATSNSMIDPKDLRPMKATELQIGGVFYLKCEDGFHTCRIFKEELKSEIRRQELKKLTEQYSKEGRLFVRINKPFQSFV
jgi:hypothetical protein